MDAPTQFVDRDYTPDGSYCITVTSTAGRFEAVAWGRIHGYYPPSDSEIAEILDAAGGTWKEIAGSPIRRVFVEVV